MITIEGFDLGARIDAEFRVARARKEASARTKPATAYDTPQIIATSLVCALCDREHWRPDLSHRCVRCELRARRLRLEGRRA